MVQFGATEGVYYNVGTGIAGTMCSLLNFILTFTPISITIQYVIYLVIVILSLVAMITITIKWDKCYNGSEEEWSMISNGEKNDNSL